MDTLHRDTANGKGFLVGFTIGGQNKDRIRSGCEILKHLSPDVAVDILERRPRRGEASQLCSLAHVVGWPDGFGNRPTSCPDNSGFEMGTRAGFRAEALAPSKIKPRSKGGVSAFLPPTFFDVLSVWTASAAAAPECGIGWMYIMRSSERGFRKVRNDCR